MANDLGFSNYVCQVNNTHTITPDVSSYYLTHSMVYSKSPLLTGNGTKATPLAIKVSAEPHNGLSIGPKHLEMNGGLMFDVGAAYNYQGVSPPSGYTVYQLTTFFTYARSSIAKTKISYMYCTPTRTVVNPNKTILPVTLVTTIDYMTNHVYTFTASLGNIVAPSEWRYCFVYTGHENE